MITGKKLSNVLNIDSHHSLYRKDGLWYHHLKLFPGVLFDINGYIVFNSQEIYKTYHNLQHAKDLHVINGISSLNGYIRFDKKQIEVVASL